MPIPQMFSNIDVLTQARRNVNHKIALARQGTEKVPKPVVKKINKEGKEIVVPPNFDVRHPTDIASLIIDTTNVPEEEREAYFINQAEQIARAFYTLDEKTNMPNPEAIKPYIKMVYDKMTCDMNINWDSVDEVERLLATMQASQGFATLVKDFPSVVLDLYPTVGDIDRLDSLTAKSSLIVHDAYIALDDKPDPHLSVEPGTPAFNKSGEYNTFENRMISELGHPVYDARLTGSDTIYLDAVASDFTKKHFLDESFEFDNGYSYTSDHYSKDYLDNFSRSYKQTSVEQMPDKAIEQAIGDSFFRYERLFINGKSIRDSIRELQEEQNYSAFDAQAVAGKMLTHALTDGKSIVTMMQVITAKDGKTEFRHQEVKVDLDRLNSVDKEETNYSLFRRFLDWAHIWKIQRFKTNDDRDAAQEKMRNSKEFKNALRAAENKFIDRYNSEDVQKEIARTKPALAGAIPKIVRAEEFEKNNQLEGAPDRIPLDGIDLEPTKTVSPEPKHEDVNKTLSNEKIV